MLLKKLIKKSMPYSKLSTINTKIIIHMNDVWASYDAKNYSLKEITLSIERGANYAIVGQSGSGKFFKKEFSFPILGKAPIKTFSNTEMFFTNPKL